MKKTAGVLGLLLLAGSVCAEMRIWSDKKGNTVEA